MGSAADERWTLVDRVAAQLHARVLSGEFPPGTRLRQEALGEEFGVSRTPIREALRKLQADGIVELRPNRGAYVRRVSPREVRDACEVRTALEALAAELAANRISHAQLERLTAAEEELHASLRRTIGLRRRGATDIGDAEAWRWGRANDDFHRVIQEAAGNEVLVEALANLHRSSPRELSRHIVTESAIRLTENAREHQMIRKAIAQRDARLARELMLHHVRHSGELVAVRFEQ